MTVDRLFADAYLKVRSGAGDLLVACFVDNSRLWRLRCHQRAERSFFVRNRQFHVCARCTGIIVGLVVLPAGFLMPHAAAIVFIMGITTMLLDAFTQLWGWRTSTNGLRFVTGFFSSAPALGATYAFLRRG